MLVIRLLDGRPNHISIYGATCSFREHQPDFLAIDIKYHVSSHLINLTLSEERQGARYLFTFCSGLCHHSHMPPSMRLRKVVTSVTSIKEFYWRLWFGDEENLPELNVRDTFVGPDVNISASDVEALCAVVGNQQEKFGGVGADTGSDSGVGVPMIVISYVTCKYY